jgi:hypothetical protein
VVSMSYTSEQQTVNSKQPEKRVCLGLLVSSLQREL